MPDILVSIIVPVYNVENTLARCLYSILNQSYANIEVIIVDDCSSDRSEEIYDSIQKKDNRVSIIKNSFNMGLSNTRNIGINHASGNYIVFVDSDDFIEKNMVEKLLKVAVDYNSDLVFCDYQDYPSSKPIDNVKGSVRIISGEVAFSLLLQDEGHYCAVWSKLIKKELFSDVSFPKDNRYGEDMFVVPRLIKNAKCISHINNPLYYYSQEGESLVRSNFNEHKFKKTELLADWVKFAKENYPKTVRLAERYYMYSIINMAALVTDEGNRFYYYKLKKMILSKYIYSVFFNKLPIKSVVKGLLIIIFSPKCYHKLRDLVGLE